MKTRIYLVSMTTPEGSSEFLVEAASAAQAERHVADKFITSEVASGKTIARLMQRTNGRVEVAGDADSLPLPLDPPLS